MRDLHLHVKLYKLPHCSHHHLIKPCLLRLPRRSGIPKETWDRALSIHESQMLSVCLNIVLHTFFFVPLMVRKYSLLQVFSPLDPGTANFLLGLNTLTAFEMNIHCFSWLLSDQKWSKTTCLSSAVSLGCWHRLQLEWQGFLRWRALRTWPEMAKCSFPEFKAILAARIFRRDGYSIWEGSPPQPLCFSGQSCWFRDTILVEE